SPARTTRRSSSRATPSSRSATTGPPPRISTAGSSVPSGSGRSWGRCGSPMAIEKIEGAPKVEWTAPTLISLGVSLVLVIVSLLLGWFGFSNWRFKSNLVECYQEYDRGHPPAAKKLLEGALSWRPNHTGARELLAKILCDEGKISEAFTQYQRLVAQGYAKPQVHVGLGVLALKEVETLDKPKAIEAKVAEAA